MDNPGVIVLGIAAVLGLMFLVFWWLAQGGKKIAAEREERLKRATKAQATVVQLGKSSPRPKSGTTIVKLRLEIRPPQGEVYEVSTVWEVQQTHLPQIQPGQKVGVKIDVDNSEIIYPNVNWAEFDEFHWRAWVK
jgi:hypothetical protein